MDEKPLTRVIITDPQGNETGREVIGTVTNIHISSEGVTATVRMDDSDLIRGRVMPPTFSIRKESD